MYMYVHICIFMYMYIACTYMFMLVRNLVNMYIHVCTMYRDVCTDLPILVQVVRIPDADSEGEESIAESSVARVPVRRALCGLCVRGLRYVCCVRGLRCV